MSGIQLVLQRVPPGICATEICTIEIRTIEIRTLGICALGICVMKMTRSCGSTGIEPRGFGMGGAVDGYDR